MRQHPARTSAAVVLLMGVWVLAYWAWEPIPPAVSFAEVPAPAFGNDRLTTAVVSDDDRSSPPPLIVASRDRARPAQDHPTARPATQPDPSVPPHANAQSSTPIAPSFEPYVVGPNETFGSIARARFGEAFDWRVVARANPLTDPDRLRAGDVIWLPAEPTAMLAPGEPSGNPTDHDPAGDRAIEYTVRSGDTLSAIADRFYGSARHTDALYRANRDQLASPDALREGQVLRIPPQASLGDD